MPFGRFSIELRQLRVFLARDALPWKRHMMTSHNWRRAVEGRTINDSLKSIINGRLFFYLKCGFFYYKKSPRVSVGARVQSAVSSFI